MDLGRGGTVPDGIEPVIRFQALGGLVLVAGEGNLADGRAAPSAGSIGSAGSSLPIDCAKRRGAPGATRP
jgi:hypothetical protein